MPDRPADPRPETRADNTPPAPTPPFMGGSMPAGLEWPPRQHPPNPQHPEIPQTFDPRVSVQLDRTVRDLEAGQDGVAALEDLQRTLDAPRRGAGPQPLPRSPATHVEGIPPRETVVTFSTQFASYFAGERAAFTPDEAARLDALGVTEGGEGPPATDPPVNVDVPHVSQAGAVLTCTMGNWEGEPTSYSYQWQIDGADVGTDADSYTATAGDVGKTATCIVTATTDIGSTAAPPSVGVVVGAIT